MKGWVGLVDPRLSFFMVYFSPRVNLNSHKLLWTHKENYISIAFGEILSYNRQKFILIFVYKDNNSKHAGKSNFDKSFTFSYNCIIYEFLSRLKIQVLSQFFGIHSVNWGFHSVNEI